MALLTKSTSQEMLGAILNEHEPGSDQHYPIAEAAQVSLHYFKLDMDPTVPSPHLLIRGWNYCATHPRELSHSLPEDLLPQLLATTSQIPALQSLTARQGLNSVQAREYPDPRCTITPPTFHFQ